MDEQPDSQLLREYMEQRNEAAFRELVRRYTDLVYSAALRQVNSTEAARDVAQEVFSDLASKAKNLVGKSAGETSLAGWLYRSTHFLALNHRRDERRRSERERQVMQEINPTPEAEPEWERIRPVLDEAMDQLPDEDREAVLLRYFKNDSMRSVGVALGVSEDAAQKRVSRAVERLRESFTKRGITIGTGGLVAVISANAVQSAPLGLALTISTAAALTGTTLATTATVTGTKAIAMTALQKTILGATIAVLAGAGIYQTYQATMLRHQNQRLLQQQAPMTERIEQLQRERDDVTHSQASTANQIAKLQNDNSELLKLRGEVGLLRKINSELKENQLKTINDGKGISFVSRNIPKQSWSYVGNATPEAALQSVIWAFWSGDSNAIVNLMPMEERPGFLSEWANISQQASNMINTVSAIDVLNMKTLSESEVLFEVRLEGHDTNFLETLPFRRSKDGWLAVPTTERSN